jgi:hypothetical protein
MHRRNNCCNNKFNNCCDNCHNNDCNCHNKDCNCHNKDCNKDDCNIVIEGPRGPPGPRGIQGIQGPTGNPAFTVGARGFIQTSDGSGGLFGNTGFMYNPSDLCGNTLELSGNFLPSIGNSYDLGSTGSPWRDLYLGPNSLKFVKDVNTIITLDIDSSNIPQFNSGLNVDYLNVVGGNSIWRIEVSNNDLVINSTDNVNKIYSLTTGSTGSFDYVAKQNIDMSGFNIINFGYSPQLLTNFTQASPTSTIMTFTWSPPTTATNNNLFMQNNLVSITILLYALVGGSYKTIPILTADTASINMTSLTINNTAGTSSLSGSTYNYYDATLTGMADYSYNALAIWYSNGYPVPNVFTQNISPFTGSGPPSAPTITTPFTFISLNVYDVSYAFSYTDATNQTTGPPYITTVDISYSTPGSSLRYGGAISDACNNVITISNTNANTKITTRLSNIRQASTYTIDIKAKNNINSTTYGAVTTNTYTTADDVLFPSGTYPSGGVLSTTNAQYTTQSTIRMVSGNASLNNPLVNMNNASSMSIVPFVNLINSSSYQIGTRLSASNKLFIDISFSGATVNYHLPTPFTYGGFGAEPPSNSSDGTNIALTGSVSDSYAASADYNKGFYLEATTSFTPGATIFKNNGFARGTSLTNYTAFFKYVGDSNYTSVNSTSSSFYLDDISTNPTITNATFSCNTSLTTTLISGINVITGNANTFTIDASYTNMGNYFYRTPLVTYTLSPTAASISETNTTNVASSSINGGTDFKSTLGIKNTGISYNFLTTNVYTTDLSLSSIVANNINGSSSAVASNSLKVLVDVPSYNLVQATTPLNNTIAEGSSNISGLRVWSGITANNSVPPVFVSNGDTMPKNDPTVTDTASSIQGYIDFSYNQLWDISNNAATNQELMVANGNFTSDYANYYKNYSTFQGNSLNYSGVAQSGYRYATFGWQINAFTQNSLSDITLTFQIPSTQIVTLNNMQIFYRTEDGSNPDYFGIGTKSSTWISVYLNNGSSINNNGIEINGNQLNEFSSANYNDISKLLYSNVDTITIAGTTCSFNVPIYTIVTNTSNMRLYVRFGLPMTSAYNFGNSSPIKISV